MDRPVGGEGTDTPQRLAVAKDELKKTLGSLGKEAMGNVMFFASEYYTLSKQGLVPIARTLPKLVEYIDKQQIPDKRNMNRGNLFDPIFDAAQQEEVDTLYLVTEGNPTEGRFIDRDRFVHHMMQIVKFTKTEVNALFIGNADSAKRYLREVAEPTGGQFYDVSEMGGR